MIHLENYLEERAQKVWLHEKHAVGIWERNRTNPDISHHVVECQNSEADGDDSDDIS